MARTGHIYDWDVNQNATFPAGITATSFNGPIANALTLNGVSYDGSAAISLSSQQLGVPSAFIHKSVSTLDCNTEKIGRVLSSSSANALINGPSDVGSDGAGILWNVPFKSPLSLIDGSGAWQYMYQIFAHLSGQIYIRKNSSNGTATWAYGEWAKILTDKNFALPIASSSTLGGVKIGSGLTVAADGTISAAAQYTLPTASSSVKGGIKVGTGLTMSSETLNHSNSVTAKTAYGSTATTASANGGSITVTDIKYDAQGHITGSTDRTITLSQTTYTLAGLMGSAAKGSATQPVYWNGSAWVNTTYTLGKSVPADAKFTDTVYTLPTASSSTLGGIKLGTGLTATADGTVNVSAGGATQSETISIAITDWSGSGPYTATKTLTNTYDSTTHDIIISLPQMSSSDVAKYDAIASAKMVISACNGTSVTIVALGDKPTVPVSIAIMQV